MMTFTTPQKLACDISRNIAVTAGAGSGKTSVLVERYLWCLENTDYDTRRIVAITFTEKAAGEMLGRIRQQVSQRIESQLGDPVRWEGVLEKLPLAYISTIHGFCQRLLREFPIEAGVDPNFEVSDEAFKRILLIQLLDDFIREHAASGDANLGLLAQLWSPANLRAILLQLVETRSKSLPWARRILQDDFPAYRNQLETLRHELQQQGIQRIATDERWCKTIEDIRMLIPPGDTSKLTTRCLNILDFDQEFREQTEPDRQITILEMLRKECRMVAANKRWKEEERHVRLKAALTDLKERYAHYLPRYEFREPLEQQGFLAQQALARFFLSAYDRYRQEKVKRQFLDFDDLQDSTLTLLRHAEVHPLLIQRFKYVMVDEFQDTNQVQWNLIESLGTVAEGLSRDRFCIVGDEKQSIYMFRGADVAVFGDVRNALKQTNAAHGLEALPPKIQEHWERPEIAPNQHSGELSLAENFRSSHALIGFFNYLFSRIFLTSSDVEHPYDVQHQNLRPGLAQNSAAGLPESPVEFLLVMSPENQTNSSSSTELEEPELVARRIRQLVTTPPSSGDQTAWRYRDIAILLRTRTRLKQFEEALRRDHIPFVVAGGIGFFQQQEIYDLANLFRVLVDTRQDIALAGVLRSPLFSFSDDQLLYLASSRTTHSTTAARERESLWRLLQRQAHEVELDTQSIPEELNPSRFLSAFRLLTQWKTLVDRIPISHLLRQILDDIGLYGILASGSRATQSVTNIEKLLDIARTFEQHGFQTLSDFVLYLDQLIEIEEREGEAQLHTEGMDVVQLMTIHAAKGLEFPMVFLPELDRSFNYGASDSLYLDSIDRSIAQEALPTVVAGIKAPNPEQNYEAENTMLREYLKHLNEEKTDAEMKRLLYVACTRARQKLLFSATAAAKCPKNSWLAWFSAIFPLTDAMEQGEFTLVTDAPDDDPAIELRIPVSTSLDETPLSEQTVPLSAVPASSSEIQDETTIQTRLQQNLRPLKGPENEIFQINPSTLHLLFQCPRKYYYQHMLQLDAPLLKQLFFPFQEQTPPTEEPVRLISGKTRGTFIHRMFEERIFDRELSPQQEKSLISRVLKEMNLFPSQEERMRLDRALERARAHYESTGLKQLLARSTDIYREHPFLLRLGRAEISGILDVLFFDPEHKRWTILDYKSNEVEAEQIEAEIAVHGYQTQMQVYAMAVSRLLQTEAVHSILFFSSPGVRCETIDLSRPALDRLEAAIISAHDRCVNHPEDLPGDPRIYETCEYQTEGRCQLSGALLQREDGSAITST